MKKLYIDFKEGKSTKFIWIISILVALFLFFLPALLSQPIIWGMKFFDLSNSGNIGSAIGGITGPFIAFFASIITFYAFWVQFQSNKAQTLQFKKSDDLDKINRFETKFYELLRIHRENVNEISKSYNGKIINQGRNAFSSFYNEYKFCYYKLDRLSSHNKNILNNDEILNISFLVFYYGVGENTRQLLYDVLPKEKSHIIDSLISSLLLYRNDWRRWIEEQLKIDAISNRGENPTILIPLNNRLNAIKVRIDNTDKYFEYSLKYKPFGGHLSRLGHYYRHLYQMIKLIDEFDNKSIENKDLQINKSDYSKLVRAQISSDEQLLLFYNSLSIIGEGWLRNNYIKKYNLLKNIPLPLANIGKSPIDVFGKIDEKGEKRFQWDSD